MEIAVTIKARAAGEVRRFLNSYYEKTQDISRHAMQITYIFLDAVEAHDMVNVFVDNADNYCAEIWVDFEGRNYRVTDENLYKVLCDILTIT